MAILKPRARGVRALAIGAMACGLSVSAAPAFAQGDTMRGEELAQRWCATCHIVDLRSTGQAAVDPAPPFPMMAGTEPEILKARITRPHVQMPELNLGRRDVDDLVAYIRTLRPTR